MPYKQGDIDYKGITEGCLYGGMWSDGEKPSLRNDVCGKALEIPALDDLPAEGIDIYVREVPECYVVPRFVNYRHGGVYHTLFMAPVDIPEAEQIENVPYQKTGFVFSGEAMQSFEAGQAELYDNVILTTPDTVKTYNSEHYLGESYPGSLACYELPDARETEWNGSPVTVRAYVVTLDNVKVFATTAKTITFGSQNMVVCNTPSQEERRTEVYTDPQLSYGAERLPMLRMNSFALGDAADEDIVLTLHTDGLVCKTRGTAGSDLRALAGTPTLAGSLFTGWYLDEACIVPADFSAITADTALYADFVPAAGLLELEARPMTVRGRIVRLQLLSACDITAESCGFIVDRGGRLSDFPADCYRSVDGTTAQASFGANPETATLFTCDLPAAMLDSAAEIRVTPFWTTPDGCRVCGKTVTVRLDK